MYEISDCPESPDVDYPAAPPPPLPPPPPSSKLSFSSLSQQQNSTGAGGGPSTSAYQSVNYNGKVCSVAPSTPASR